MEQRMRTRNEFLAPLAIALALINRGVLSTGDIVRWIDVLIFAQSDYHERPEITLAQTQSLLSLRSQILFGPERQRLGEYTPSPEMKELLDELEALRWRKKPDGNSE